MPLLKPAEKEDLKLLSGMSRNQLGPSATGSSSSRPVATPIVPGQALGYNNSQTTSRPAGSSPWGNPAAYKNNLHANRGASWQPSSSTLTNQHKKRKTQHYDLHIEDSATPRSRPRHSVPNGSSSRHLASSSTYMYRESSRGFHDVYNVDEDVGEIISSDDPFLLKSPSPRLADPSCASRHSAQSLSLATPSKRGDLPMVNDSPYGSRAEASFPSSVSDYAPRKRRSSSTEMEIPLAEDGPSISRSRRETPYPPRVSSPLDSIESFSPEPVPAPSLQSAPAHSTHSSPGRKAIPNLIVPLRMAAYTNNDTSVVQPVPHIDLSNPPKLKRKLIAKSMQANQKQPKDAIATASTAYRTSKPKATAAKSEDVVQLPIQRGYVGTQSISNTPERILCYTKSKKTISLFEKGNATRGPETHELSLRVDGDVEVLQTCDDDGACMVKFKLKEHSRSVKIHNEQFRSFCNDDHEDAYMLLLAFDSDEASAHSFATLSTILRNVTQGECQMLTRFAAESLWEAHEITSQRVAPLQQPSGLSEPPATAPLKGRLVKIPSIYTSVNSGGARTSGDEPLPRLQGARRSARVSHANESPVEEPGPSNLVPQPADDELILIHPPTGTGAFHITRGDRRRLGPSEFLNDTLIEFGLKLWMDDLRSTSPELADQIYVFNSFFYNKLTSVPRKVEEGYLNVRKWTSKIDLFKKKYIIVPINENLHWYLAIICDPQHVLQLPLPKKAAPLSVLTRHQRRQDGTYIELDSPFATGEDLVAPSAATDDADGQEVEGLLNSCSLSQDVGDQPPERPTTPMPAEQRKPSSPLSSPPPRIEPVRAKGQMLAAKSVLANTGTSPAMFYGGSASSASKGKQKATSPILNVDGDGDVEMPDAPPVEADDASLASPAEMVPIRPTTMIFTLDSLGSKHGAAINNLGRYLQLEAADKRKLPLEESTRADGHKALVPTQPNFCDCGLYLLFFVRQFFTDPEGFRERMTGPAAERKSAWKERDASNMREQYASQIDALAEEWQKTRPEKPKAAPAEVGRSEAPEGKAAATATAAAAAVAVDSDDEIVVMGESVPLPKAKAPPKARPRKPAGAAAKRKGKGKAEAEEEPEVVEGKTVGKAERVR